MTLAHSKQEEEAKKLMDSTDKIKKRLAAKEVEVQEAKSTLDAKVMTICNIVYESMPFSDDEANNKIVRAFGEKRVEDNLKNHVDLCRMLDIVALEKVLLVLSMFQSYYKPDYGETDGGGPIRDPAKKWLHD
ncbi:hypothetical protein Zm00014a_038439 [Zea mays]|uniref:Uncharacterized protein n=1 Tax=Zea mays TaxID=4577 RepID=A0A3L6D9W1_MAIZE|nr:hypothetical protein Zm00014a_038439 [Zea mays]